MRGFTTGRRIGAILVLVLTASVSQAATWEVRPDGTGDVPSIRVALEAAVHGDTIALGDGVFRGADNASLSYLGKRVVVRSQSGNPDLCVIDCENARNGFTFITSEGAGSVLEGVTILNARSTHGAGVICASGASPIIRRCVFLDGEGSVGAGVYCNASSPLIERCRFVFNTASYGGAVACRTDAAPILSECTFVANTALRGGAVTSEFSSMVTLRYCTAYGNSADLGSSVYCREYGMATIENCILACGESGSATVCATGGVAVCECTNVFGHTGGDWDGCLYGQLGIAGNICADPLFCGPAGGDFRLDELSPCIPLAVPADGCDRMGAWGVGSGHALVQADGSGDFPTLQAAIDGSSDGDVICLGPGVYRGPGNRDVDFGGKAVRLLPADVQGEPPRIDCEGAGRAFVFQSGEDAGSVVSGCLITVGLADFGGAVICQSASPAFTQCTFQGNSAERGGAVYCAGPAAPQFLATRFADNQGAASGGALAAEAGATLRLRHCSLGFNRAPSGSGIAAAGETTLRVDRVLIAFGEVGEAITGGIGCDAELSYCDLYGNAGGDWIGIIADQKDINGNLSVDPLLCPASDLTLDDRSPCLPARPLNTGVLIGAQLPNCQMQQVRHVYPDGSGAFATIQAAISASRHGDTILLADGVYSGAGNFDLVVGGLGILIRSESGNPANCIIECAHAGPGFTFAHNETRLSEIRDLTVRNGVSPGG